MTKKSKKFTKKSGFTLIELLIVIGITVIISVIVLVSIGNSRQKAKDKSVLSSMNSIQKTAIVCSGSLLNMAVYNPGTAVCTGMGTYPDIAANGSGWTYGGYTIGANSCALDTASSDGRFTICAYSPSASPTKGINCNETKCTTIGS